MVTVKKMIWIFAVLSFLASAVSAGASEKVLLRYKGKVGDEEINRFLANAVVTFYDQRKWSARTDDIWHKTEPEIITIYKEQLKRARILSVDKEGVITESFSYKNVLSLMDQNGVERVRGPGEWVGMLKAKRSPLGEEEMIDLPLWKEGCREKRIPQITLPFLPALPEGKVGAGDTWTGPGRVIHTIFPVPDLSYEISYRLERFEDVNDRRCAVIKGEAKLDREFLEGEWETQPWGVERKVDMKDFKQVFRNEYLFDIESGRVIRTQSLRISSYRQISNSRKGERKWGREDAVKASTTITIVSGR